jgi:hypothetical protein
VHREYDGNAWVHLSAAAGAGIASMLAEAFC